LPGERAQEEHNKESDFCFHGFAHEAVFGASSKIDARDGNLVNGPATLKNQQASNQQATTQ
jgi:hypothetical protein